MNKQEPIIWKTEDGDIRIHELKTWTEFFDAVIETDPTKRKTLEVRKFDRDYKVGDFLRLLDYNPKDNTYSGRETWRLVTHIVEGEPFLPNDTVALSLFETMPSIKF